MSSLDGLIFNKLSEKKQNKKKKSTKKIPKSSSKNNSEKIIIENDEGNLILNDADSIQLNPVDTANQIDKALLELEINYDLNVSQPLSLFFDMIDPQVIILSGTTKYDEQYKLLVKQESSTIYIYKSWEEMFAQKLEHPRLQVEHCPRAKSFNLVQKLLSRSDYLSCLSSDSKFLFIYGGRNGNVVHDDFISYDITANVLYVYKKLHLASHESQVFRRNICLPPGLIGYEMIEYDKVIYIFGKGEIHRIENVTDPLNVKYSIPVTRSVLTNRTQYTITKVLIENRLHLYLYGGKTDKGLDKHLHVLKFTNSTYEPFTCNTISPTKQEFNNVGRWPDARYGHSACKVSNSIFIYGGVGNGDRILNDLFMLDVKSNIWTEIRIHSAIPPPLFKHCSFSINERYFYIYGGNKSEGVSNCLYGYDIVDNKWNLIEIISEEMKRNISGAKCLTTAKGEIFTIGSIDKEKNHQSFSKLLNLGEPFKPISVLQYVNQKREEGYLCDVAFKVTDLENSSYILAHKCIVKVRCPSLYNKIQQSKQTISVDQFNGTFLEKEIIVVEISECNSNTLMKYLTYLYNGTIHLKANESLPFISFVQEISTHKHYPIIQKIYTSELKSIETTVEILNTIQKDFSSLLGDSVESDLTLVLDNNDDTVEEIKIQAHRLFMSRSPFFSKMLVSSGMIETIEKTVHLKDYSKEVMLDLLNYLYSNKLQLNPNNALGLLIYSLLFDMEELASCCRTLVVSLLESSTVCSIYEVATFHNDLSLQRACENFMANNYLTLSTTTSFTEIVPEKTRIALKQTYERKIIIQKEIERKEKEGPKVRIKERDGFFF